MAVLINFKICDNSSDCNGVRDCPTGAFGWDESKKSLYIDEDKCVNCGECQTCSVGAIKVTYSDEETERIKREIEEDPRTLNDLFVDRYGATPIQEMFTSTEENIGKVIQSPRPFMLELYTEETIQCLLNSIPIKEILGAFDKECAFRKIEVKTDELTSRYKVNELPALVFINNGEFFGKVEGYYEEENKNELLSLIAKIPKV